jgi:putative addiction module antidote
MYALKIRKIGGAQGVILPKEALARLKVAEGDKLYLTEAPDGFRLTGADPEFERQMDAYQEISKQRRNVFKALAK